jgi:glycosyltransferase involved in cell wall biosynthesis
MHRDLSLYAIPALASVMGRGIPAILLALLLIRIAGTAAFFACCLLMLPGWHWKIRLLSRAELGKLFSYSGWIAISNCIIPFLVQIDRYLIAAIVSVAAVTYYAVPFELMNGLWIIPASMAAVMFPGFSCLQEGDGRMTELFARSAKYILLLLGIAAALVSVFGFDILRLWQGAALAGRSSAVLTVLSLGVLINSVGWVPANFLMGRGRPDVPAKIHMIQVPIYLAGAWLLITWFGIVGAAVAFTLRVTIESSLLFQQAFRLSPQSVRLAFNKSFPSALSLLGLAAILETLRHLFANFTAAAGAAGVVVAVFGVWAWYFLLDARDRNLVRDRMRHFSHRETAPRATRVLYVGADDVAGGVANYISSMAGAFAAHGIECHVTVSEKRITQPVSVFPGTFVRHGFTLNYRPWSLAESALKLRRILRREQIDLLHLHTARGGLVGVLAALGTGIPVLYTGHSLRFEQKQTALTRLFFRWYERIICSLADRSTMLTKRDRRVAIHCRVVAPERSVVVATRIPAAGAPHHSSGDASSRTGFVMGAVGSLDERKDPLTFVRAARFIADQWPDASFVWVGDGGLRQPMEHLASDLGIIDRLTITGNVSKQEVNRWLHTMSVFVSCSRIEGVPLAVLEAFAARIPVVACRYAGSGWYYVIRGNETGLTFAPGDAEGCARQVLRLALDEALRERIAVGGSRLFAARYSGADLMAQEFIGLYSELLRRPVGELLCTA